MKRKFFLPLLTVLALTIYSCSTEETLVSAPTQTRDTQSTDSYSHDENILQNYVFINKTNKQYYMDYSQSTPSLAQVKPENKKRFEKQLDDLNLSIKEASKNNNLSIYLETRKDRYFSDNDDSITETQNPNTQDIHISYLELNTTSITDRFYVKTKKSHSIIRVSTASYDDPIQMTIQLKNAVAGKGNKRIVFIASPVRVINALINWTDSNPNQSQSDWPVYVTKNKRTSGYISFYPGHIGSLLEMQ